MTVERGEREEKGVSGVFAARRRKRRPDRAPKRDGTERPICRMQSRPSADAWRGRPCGRGDWRRACVAARPTAASALRSSAQLASRAEAQEPARELRLKTLPHREREKPTRRNLTDVRLTGASDRAAREGVVPVTSMNAPSATRPRRYRREPSARRGRQRPLALAARCSRRMNGTCPGSLRSRARPMPTVGDRGGESTTSLVRTNGIVSRGSYVP